jgi:hypothetical protein
MGRANAVIMDVRGLKRDRRGCEFELQQLASVLLPRRVVLVADATTETVILEQTFGPWLSGVTVIQMHGSRDAQSIFEALLMAAA